jgi:hypothetical protein
MGRRVRAQDDLSTFSHIPGLLVVSFSTDGFYHEGRLHVAAMSHAMFLHVVERAKVRMVRFSVAPVDTEEDLPFAS